MCSARLSATQEWCSLCLTPVQGPEAPGPASRPGPGARSAATAGPAGPIGVAALPARLKRTRHRADGAVPPALDTPGLWLSDASGGLRRFGAQVGALSPAARLVAVVAASVVVSALLLAVLTVIGYALG